MATVLSPNRYVGRTGGIRVIVLHTMETPETGVTAESVAAYFARPTTKASAHLCVDNNSVVRCVPDGDTAWAAPGANADGLQIEMAGRAAQTPAHWADTYSTSVLALAAAAVRTWCQIHGIPARYLTDAQLADGKTKGITTHAQVSRVFKRSDHTDPGKDFPAARFLALVQGAEEDEVTPQEIKTAVTQAITGLTVKDSAGRDVPLVSAVGYTLRNTQTIGALQKANVDQIATAVAAKVGAGASAEDIAKALLIQLTKETP